MERERSRSPRIDRQYIQRMSTGQILQLLSLCINELLARLHVPANSLQALDPPDDPTPAPRTPEIALPAATVSDSPDDNDHDPIETPSE